MTSVSQVCMGDAKHRVRSLKQNPGNVTEYVEIYIKYMRKKRSTTTKSIEKFFSVLIINSMHVWVFVNFFYIFPLRLCELDGNICLAGNIEQDVKNSTA